MSIYITGDTHGKLQERFGVKNFPEQRSMSEGDYVIVLGDCGLIWDSKQSAEERYLIRWLDEKKWTTLFIDGNHENFDRLLFDEFEEVEFCGGRAKKISEKIYYLMRGEMYTIEGKTFFCFGGAQSHDIDNLLDPENDPNWKRKRKNFEKAWESYRVIGRSWWARELPSQEEMTHGCEVLEKAGWKCDYVLSHTPPASAVKKYSEDYEPDLAANYLEKIKSKLSYRHWFCGHLHGSANITKKIHLLYRDIVKILK